MAAEIPMHTPVAGYVAPVLSVIGTPSSRRRAVRRTGTGSGGATILELPPRAAWAPAINVFDTGASFVIIAELAGVGPDSIRIELDQERDTLTLQGSRAGTPPAATSSSAVTVDEEIAAGRFERRISFDTPLDADGARAVCRYGLLELMIPKLPQREWKRPPSSRNKSGGGGIRTPDTLAGIAV